MIIKEKAIRYGDNIDTDVIIPARYLNTSDHDALAAHCFEDLDETFKEKAKTAKIIIGGENFGCGSSREHAPLSIKASGIKLIVAKSFARIFFRNAINIGLPVIQNRQASENIDDGDMVEADLEKGIIKNMTKNMEFKIKPLPDFIEKIIDKGGYINYIKSVLKKSNSEK